MTNRRYHSLPLLTALILAASMVPQKSVADVLTFQQGVGGYTGLSQTTLFQLGAAADQVNGGLSAGIWTADGGNGAFNDGQFKHALIRFDNIFGSGPGQIPLGSTITAATITANYDDPSSSAFAIYRMLQTWSPATATWNTFTAGVQNDGTEAAVAATTTFSNPNANAAGTYNAYGTSLASDLQLFSNGTSNFGWVVLPTSGNAGWGWTAAQTNTPVLSVTFTPPVTNQPLAVAITSPANNATVGANFTINATATVSPATITSVTFFDGATQLGVDNSSPYSLAVTGASLGSHTLTAVALDSTNASLTSAAVNVTVANQPPTVSLTNPTEGSAFTVGTNVTLDATATDDVSVTQVEFFVDNVPLSTDTTSPYSATWSNVPLGAHTLKAVATDSGTLTTTSTVVNVTVAATVSGALSFDGVDDRVTMGTALGLGAQTFTLECWVKHDPSGAGRTTASSGSGGVNIYPLISKGRGEGDGSNIDCNYAFGLQTDGRLAADFEDLNSGLNHPIVGTNAVPSNTWHHVAVTYDGNTWRFYIDGVLDNSLLLSGSGNVLVPRSDSIQHFGLGTAMTSTGAVQGFYKGVMDEVRVWNVARSQVQIQGAMNSEIPSATGLIGRWSLNETSGTTATNTGSASAVNGTLVNGPSPVAGYPFNPLPPTVSITSPANNATLLSGFTINATAADSDGTIASVTFFDGATQLGIDSTSPYSQVVTGAALGSHALTAVALDNSGASTTSTVVNVTVVSNLPPTVSITSPANNAGVDDDFTISADAADSDGSIASVSFYDGATLLGTDNSSPFSFAVAAAAVGSHPLTAVALDNGGASTTSAIVNVTVAANLPPTVSITSPANNANVNDDFTIFATAADSDGSVSSVSFYDGATLLGTDNSSPYSFAVSGAALGGHALTAVAEDDDNASTTSSVVDVTVIPNLPPTVSITSPADNGIVGAAFTISATAADSDGTVASVAFYDGATLLGTDTSSPFSHDVAAAALGGHPLTAVATDDDGDSTTSAVVNVTVVENLPPTVSITSPANNANVDDDFTISADAADSDGSVASVAFYDGATLLGTDNSSPFSFAVTAAAVGAHALTAVAVDDDNASTTSTVVNVTIAENTPPAVAITSPADNATVTTDFTISATASDNDGSVASVAFYDGATLLSTDVTSPFSYDVTGAALGNHALTAVALDDDNAPTTSAAINITVVSNLPPTVSITSPANNATVDDDFVITATAADSDGSIASVAFYDGATLLGTDNSSPFSFAVASAAVGGHALTAVAVDDDTASTTSTVVNVTVAANLPPTVSITSPANNATLGTGFTITATAADSDGTIASVAFYDGATLLNTDTSSPYSFTVSGAAGGSHALTAVALDDDNTPTTSAVVNVTVSTGPVTLLSQNFSTDPVNYTLPGTSSPFRFDGSPPRYWALSNAVGLTVNAGITGAAGTYLGTQNLDSLAVNPFSSAAPAQIDFTVAAGNYNNLKLSIALAGMPTAEDVNFIRAKTDNNGDGTYETTLFEFKGASNSAYTDTVLGALTAPFQTFANITLPAPTAGDGMLRLRLESYNDTDSQNEATGIDTILITGTPTGPVVPPTVALTAPAEAANVFVPGNTNLAATAGDTDGSVAKVEFFDGATKLGEDTTSPYTLVWSPTVLGSHSLTAKATDNQGNTTTSTAVNVTGIANPNQPPVITLTAPANLATITGSSTTLSANIVDPEGDAQTVTFYGRQTAPVTPGPDFTFVAIPDTQFYSEDTGRNPVAPGTGARISYFNDQTQWITANRVTKNIAFVAHMGDMVQNGDSIDAEWVRASGAMGLIENPLTTLLTHGIPWGGAPGNHDFGTGGGTGTTTKWNQYFGTTRWAGRTYFRGNYGSDNNNNYQFFSAGGLDFIVINLAYRSTADTAVHDWADALLKAHPNRRAIITSHWIIGTGNPATFGGQGQAIYDNLKDNPNLFLLLCGHVHGEGRRSDVFQTRTVHSVLQDYQDAANGGNGFLRTFTFSPATNLITAEMWSPTLNRTATTADTSTALGIFTLPYNMQGAITDWIPLGTVNVPANGTTASLDWTGLEHTKDYEWYATANDSVSTASSTTRRFTTAPAVPPTVSITAPANSSTYYAPATVNIAATANDSDGSVTKVEFYRGATKLGEDTTAPYEYTATGQAVGNYTLTAVATDNQNNTTTSAGISITVSVAPSSGTLSREPYLNQNNQNSIVVRWRSSQSIVGRVRYGDSPTNLTNFTDEAAAATNHVVKLTGLAPYTRYYYSVGSAFDTLAGGDANHTFRTSPVPGTATDTRIWVVGDCGRGNQFQRDVRDAYYAWTGARTPDLCLMLGDNAYNTGTDAEYKTGFFDIYPTTFRKMPLWSTLGNHDANIDSATGTTPFFDMFTFPTLGECGGVNSGTEYYYSFDYGNIHFVNLDSQTSSRAVDNPLTTGTNEDGPMAAWLRLDLAATTKTWIVVMFHHPPYSKGSHNSDTEGQLIEMRAKFGPILEAGGVDAVLCGHSHAYERSKLIDDFYETPTLAGSGVFKNAGSGRPSGDGAYIKPLTGPRDHFGAVYAVAGSAGSADGGSLNHPVMYVSYDTGGTLNLDINGNRLDATYIQKGATNGTFTTPDTFTIIKQGAADSDSDGIPDDYELAHGLNRFNAADAALDSDGDGTSNLDEFVFDTAANASDSYAFSTTYNNDGTVTVSFPTIVGRSYRVNYSNTLLGWLPGSAPVAGTGATMTWTDDGTSTGSPPSNAARRFYQVEVSVTP